MGLNSRHLVALGAPVAVIYLTWSAVSGTPPAARTTAPAATISPTALAKRPLVAKLERDVFTRSGAFSGGDAAMAPGEEGSSGKVHLTGTVVTGRWRMAIIDGTRVFEGQTFHGFLVKTIARDKVTLVDPEGHTVEMVLDIAQPPPLPAATRAKAAVATAATGNEAAAAAVAPATATAVSKSSTAKAARPTGAQRPSAPGSTGRGGEASKERVP